jgi:hypothetical protein
MKKLRSTGITILVLFAVVFLLQRFSLLPSFGKWFRIQPILIENTPVLVENIRDLSQLITLVSFDEVVITRNDTPTGSYIDNLLRRPSLDPLKKKISLIARGRIFAGTELKQLSEDALSLSGDSAHILLPHAKILEAIVNPSDCEIFIEEGKWETSEVTNIKKEARDVMIKRALSKGILQKADAKTKLVIENFLRSVGFKKVKVETGN